MIVNNSSQLPYQACLIIVLSEEIQLPVRDFANHVVLPVNVLLIVMATLCNGFVLIAVARTKSLQRPSQIMLCNLAITDLLYSLYYFLKYLEIFGDEQLCPKKSWDKISIFSPLCFLATLGTLAIISRDRRLALKKPYWYRTHVTKSRACTLICGIWLASAIVALLSHIRWSSGVLILLGRILSFLFFVICLSVIIFSYLGVLCKRTSSVDALLARAILKREKRMADTVALILLLFLSTFLPGIFISLAHVFSKDATTQSTIAFQGFFLQLNSLLNPLLNFGRNKEMRRSLRNLLKPNQEVLPS